jgi:hypothetical protein
VIKEYIMHKNIPTCLNGAYNFAVRSITLAITSMSFQAMLYLQTMNHKTPRKAVMRKGIKI